MPDIPPHFLERTDELDGLRQKVLGDAGSVGIFGLQGMGGIGKTVLANALARDDQVQAQFPDGVYWVTVGIEPMLTRQQGRLAEAVSGEKTSITDVQQGKDCLRQCFAGKQALLILDDLWNAADAKAFAALDEGSRLLLTTRDREILTVLGAEEHTLGLLDETQSLALLADWSGCPVASLDEEARAVAQECGNLPLALSLCGAMVRDGITWSDVKEALEEADLAFIEKHFPNYPYTDVLKALEASVAALAESNTLAAERYHELAVFPPNKEIPEAVILIFWGYSGQLSPRKSRQLLSKLASKGLLKQETETVEKKVTLHDLQHDYLRARQSAKCDSINLHNQLIEAYRKKCQSNWLKGTDDGYFLQCLAYHLFGAGQPLEIEQLLLNYEWIQNKIKIAEVESLLNDYDYCPNNKDLSLIQSALRLSTHILVKNPDQLKERLWGHLQSIDRPAIQDLLLQSIQQNTVWLHPLKANLTSPGGSLLRTLDGHSASIRSVAVTSNGQLAITASDDCTLKVWDLQRGIEIKNLRGHNDWVNSVAISKDGKTAISASDDSTLKIWNPERGIELKTLQIQNDSVLSVALTPDGSRAVTGSLGGMLNVWDLERFINILTVKGHSKTISSVTITSDGKRAISASFDHTIRMWDLNNGTELTRLVTQSSLWCLALLPDGQTLVSADDSSNLKVWNLDQGRKIKELIGHSAAVLSIAVSPDGHRAVSGSFDRTVKVWDLNRSILLKSLEGHSDSVWSVALTPDAQKAVSASDDQTLKVWDLSQDMIYNTQIHNLLGMHKTSVSSIAIRCDGKQMVSASDDSTLKVWDIKRTLEMYSFKGHQDSIKSLTITPNGKKLITASLDRAIKIWDLRLTTELLTLDGHRASVRSVAVAPKHQWVISGSDDHTLKIWDLARGIEITTLKGHAASVWSVAVTTNERWIISASLDGTLKVWDSHQKEKPKVLEGHNASVLAVEAFSDGLRAISASSDRTLKVWNLEQGIEIKTISHPSGSINAVAITMDGKRAILASDDRTIKVWDLHSCHCIATFWGDHPFLTCAVAPDGVTIVAGDAAGVVHFFRLEGVEVVGGG